MTNDDPVWTIGPWAHVCRGYNDAGNEMWSLGNADDPIQFPVCDYDGMGEPAPWDRALIELAPEMAEAILRSPHIQTYEDECCCVLHDIARTLNTIRERHA